MPEQSHQEIVQDRLANPHPVMKAIGMLVVAAAQRAFEDKALGDFKWPEQYEGAPEPWIHVAGATADLSKGEGVKGSRFGPADTLMDSGDLWRSIDTRHAGRNEVHVGAGVDYAKYHQWGSDHVGPSVQTVTDAMRRALSHEISNASPNRRDALGKLWNWFRKDHVETRVQQRPFLGITEELEGQIRMAVVEFMEEGKL